MTTANLHLNNLTPSLQAHAPMNENLYWIDAILGGAIKAQRNAPSTPSAGDLYIVSGTPDSGDPWAGKAEHLALYIGGDWVFAPGGHGTRVYNRNDNGVWVKGVTTWVPSGSGVVSYAGYNSGALTTATTWGQVSINTNLVAALDSFVRGTGGDGAGDIKVPYAGVYAMELNAEVQATGAAADLDAAFGIGSQAGITPVARSTRRFGVGSGAYVHAHVVHVDSVTAGQYIAPLWQRASGSGTLNIAAGRVSLRVWKMSL